jgi:hypothetical protein
MKKVDGYEVRFVVPEGVVRSFPPKVGTPPKAVSALKGKLISKLSGTSEYARAAQEELKKTPLRADTAVDRSEAKVEILKVQLQVSE